MNQYKLYLFDLDGTLYRGTVVIQSAIDCVARLQAAGKTVLFVTNNGSVRPEDVRQKLAAFGLSIEANQVITSALVAAAILATADVQRVYLIGSAALKEACLAQGVQHDAQRPQAILTSLDTQVTYTQLAQACKLIQEHALPFYATNGDIKFPQAGHFAPGAGTIMQLIASVTDVQPMVIGKPQHYMMSYIQQQFPLIPLEDWLMIGDNYHTDMMFGIQNQVATCFVETGVHSLADVARQAVQPTYCVPDLSGLWPIASSS